MSDGDREQKMPVDADEMRRLIAEAIAAERKRVAGIFREYAEERRRSWVSVTAAEALDDLADLVDPKERTDG